MRNAVHSCFQKLLVKRVPLSETISLGSPCNQKTFWINKWTNFIVSRPFSVHPNRWTSFVRRSTITHMASKPDESGSPTMKSIDILDQGTLGIDKGMSRPYLLWRLTLFLAQILHVVTYNLTSLFKVGHQYDLSMRWIVLSTPMWPAAGTSCLADNTSTRIEDGT